jgi:hypothetical protein
MRAGAGTSSCRSYRNARQLGGLFLKPVFPGVFARSRPARLDSLGGRSTRRRVPGWLWLLSAGALAGAGGVIAIQQRHLPPRLSA